MTEWPSSNSIGPQRHIAGQRDAVAEREQVPAAAAEVHAVMDVDVMADARAEHPQGHGERMGAGHRVPGNARGQPLDDPPADVQAAPRRDAAGPTAAEQHA